MEGENFCWDPLCRKARTKKKHINQSDIISANLKLHRTFEFKNWKISYFSSKRFSQNSQNSVCLIGAPAHLI